VAIFPDTRWSGLPHSGAVYVQEMNATARRLEEIVRHTDADILHAHSPVLNALPALRVGRRHGIPVSTNCGRCGKTRGGPRHHARRQSPVPGDRMLETYALRRAII